MFVMSPPDRPDMVVVGGLMHYEELKPYVNQARPVVGQRSNGRAVLMSTDAGVNWTDMTGDVGGESMHPDQHALAFVPGNPDQFFVGSDGGVIRTSGKWADASAQCDTRALPLAANLADCHTWLKQIPTELKVMNAGLGDLQMYSISVSPYTPRHGDVRHPGQRDALVHRLDPVVSCRSPATAATAGFDAVDPHLRFHKYTNGLIDVNYNDADPTSWLWVERPVHPQLAGGLALLCADDLRHGADEDDLPRRPERLADDGRGRRPRRSSSSTATRPSARSRATSSTPAPAAPPRTGRGSARRR